MSETDQAKLDAAEGAGVTAAVKHLRETNAPAKDSRELPNDAAVKMAVRSGVRYVQWLGGEQLFHAPNWVWQLVAQAELREQRLLVVLKQADLGEHVADERGRCRCSQCTFRRAVRAAIAEAEGRQT